jgi:hypothetical protein
LGHSFVGSAQSGMDLLALPTKARHGYCVENQA